MNFIWIWNFKGNKICNFFQIEIEKEKTWPWPNNQASPPSLQAQKGPGLGWSNQPSPHGSAHFSLPSLPSSGSHETLIALPPPGDSGCLRRTPPPPPWAKCPSLRPLPPPPNRFDGRSLSEKIRGWIPLGFSLPYRLRVHHLTGLLPGARCASPRWSWCVCTSVEAPSAVLPVVLRWSLPQVASGRPCGHCPTIPSRHAPGRMVSVFQSSSSPLLSSPTMVTGHLAMISEPSSQTCFYDAAIWCKLAMLSSVSCCHAWSVMFMLWLFPCQWIFWQSVKLNLAVCNV
jgi:hypothetical protein